MSDTRYKRGGYYAADMAAYNRLMSEDNSAQHSRLERNLARALSDDITPTQRKYMMMYYGERLNMREIAERCGVERSTVSRTIKRGERRLRRCLKYGAGNLLTEADG